MRLYVQTNKGILPWVDYYNIYAIFKGCLSAGPEEANIINTLLALMNDENYSPRDPAVLPRLRQLELIDPAGRVNQAVQMVVFDALRFSIPPGGGLYIRLLHPSSNLFYR